MIHLRNLSKKMDADFSVRNLSLNIGQGETLALFGPSGCGKTTTLRLIAGFERPDQGSIAINGKVVSTPRKRLPPHQRDLGMVFQDLALWPHMRVARQLGFCLEGRLKDRASIKKRIARTLEKTRLQHKAHAYPHQLSGGQRQRLALARALVISPRCLLLDEPFTSLDPHLRAALLREVRQMVRSSNMTTVFVTHDWHEAVCLADRVAFMGAGRIEKVVAADRPAEGAAATGLQQPDNQREIALRRA